MKLSVVALLFFVMASWFAVALAGSEDLDDDFLVVVGDGFVRVYFRVSGVSINGLSISGCSLSLPGVGLSGVGFIDVNGSGVWLVTTNGVARINVGLDEVSGFLECVRGVLSGIERVFTVAGFSVYSFRSRDGSVGGELVFGRDLGFSGSGVSYALIVGVVFGFGVDRAEGFVEVRGNGVLRRDVVFKPIDHGLWSMVTSSSAWFNGLRYVRKVYVSIDFGDYVVNVSGDLVACMVGYNVPRVELKVATGSGERVVYPWVDYDNVTRVFGFPECVFPQPLFMRYNDRVLFLEPEEPWLEDVITQGDVLRYDVSASGVIVGGANFSLSPYSNVFGDTGRIEFNLSSRLLLSIAGYDNGMLGLELNLLDSDFRYDPRPKTTTPICLDVVESSCMMYASPPSPPILGRVELETIWDELKRGAYLKLYAATLFYDQLSSYASIYTSRKPYLALALGWGPYNIPGLAVTPRQLLKPSIIVVKPQLITLDSNLTIPVVNVTMGLGDKYYSNTILDSFYMLPLLVKTKASNLTVKSAILTAKGYVPYEYSVSYNYLLKTSIVRGLWRNISSTVALFKPKTLDGKALNATIEVIASCIGGCSISSIGGLVNVTSANGRPVRLIIIVYGNGSVVEQLANDVRITSGYGEHSLRSILVAGKTIHAGNGSLLFSWTPLLPPRNSVITISTLPYIIEGGIVEVPKTSYPYPIQTHMEAPTATEYSTTTRTTLYEGLNNTLVLLAIVVAIILVVIALYMYRRR